MGTVGGYLLLAVAVISQYFTERISLATGIGAAGSTVGDIIYPAVPYKPQPHIRFGWATRIIDFIILVTLTIPIVVIPTKVYLTTRRYPVHAKVLGHIHMIYGVEAFFGMMDMYIPFYDVSIYSISQGISDESLGFYVLTILNAASVFDRLISNFPTDITGPLNVGAPFVLCCAMGRLLLDHHL
jgi:hypothetical protein